MSNWPDSLVEELAYRRCVLFIGAGISATAKNDNNESPQTWGDFLEDMRRSAKKAKPDDLKFIQEMMDQKNYLMALQAIRDCTDSREYTTFLRNHFKGGYRPSDIHKAIKEIDSKIVITTNFDKIYDGLCNEDTYMILDYKSTKDITSAVKSPYNLIIKAHGNIDNTDDIIFTSEQYFNAQQVYSNFYSLLHALFLTHTVVFLGYSLSDPDINLVLSNLHNTASPNSPHYIIIKDDSNSIHVQNHWRVSYNINCLEMGQSFDEVNCNLKELRDSVVSLRQERGINQ